MASPITQFLRATPHGWVYKQHHADTSILYKRYMFQYKCFIFYWASQTEFFNNIEIIFKSLANTTLPQFQRLLGLYDDFNGTAVDPETHYRGTMTPSEANSVLNSSKTFTGLYILHGYDITRSTTLLQIDTPIKPKANVVKRIPQSESELNLGKTATQLTTAATNTNDTTTSSEPTSTVLYPISFAAIFRKQFRIVSLSFQSENDRNTWVNLLQRSSTKLIAPRLTPFLRGLTLPSKFSFGDIQIQQDLRTFLISNKYISFDVTEHLLGYYYTGSTTAGQLPSLYDSYTHCILLTTHRILRIHNNEVVFNFLYSHIDTVLFYSHNTTDSRRSLGLVNSVRYICNTSSAGYNNDQLFLIAALKGIGRGISRSFGTMGSPYSIANSVGNKAALVQSTSSSALNKNNNNMTKIDGPQIDMGNITAKSTQGNKSLNQKEEIKTVSSRQQQKQQQQQSAVPINFWFLDEKMIPEVKTMDKRSFIVLKLTTGQRVPIELTKNKTYDIFFANLLSRIVVTRHLISTHKERFASGIYKGTLRLWSWTLNRYLSLISKVALSPPLSTSPSNAISPTNTSMISNSPLQSDDHSKMSLSTRYDGKSVYGSLSPAAIPLTQTTPSGTTYQEYLTPELITGYLDFTGGETRLAQNLVNIAYQHVFHKYYKDGVLISQKHEDLQGLNKTLQAVSALDEFYREDVNYIVAGDHGLIVLDTKPVGNIFNDKFHDIPALANKQRNVTKEDKGDLGVKGNNGDKNKAKNVNAQDKNNANNAINNPNAPFYLPFTLDKGPNEIQEQLYLETQQLREVNAIKEKERIEKGKKTDFSRSRAPSLSGISKSGKDGPVGGFGKLARQNTRRNVHKKNRGVDDDDDDVYDRKRDSDEEEIMGGFATRRDKTKAMKTTSGWGNSNKDDDLNDSDDEKKEQNTTTSSPDNKVKSTDTNENSPLNVINNPETQITTLSLSHGNGNVAKYNHGYQYEFVLSDFTGHTSQQWKWNDDDMLWPFHTSYTPSYFEQPDEEDTSNNGKVTQEQKKQQNLLSKYKIDDVVTDEVWQNQRFYPFYRWSSNLLPTDRPAWSTDGGVSRSVMDANKELPVGWEWVDPQWSKAVSQNTSGEGWLYGTELTTGLNGYEIKCNPTIHVVRKRQWVRRRRLVEIITDEKEKGTEGKKMKFGGEDDGDDEDEEKENQYNLEKQRQAELKRAQDLLQLEYNRSIDAGDELDTQLIEMQTLANYAQSEFNKKDSNFNKNGAKNSNLYPDADPSPFGSSLDVNGNPLNSTPNTIERQVLQRSIQHGYGIFAEYLYENQSWGIGSGWKNCQYPVTTQTPTVIAQQHSNRIPRDKNGREIGHWSSEDWSIVLSDKHFILPGYGYHWITGWQIDKCIDGDDEFWQYTRGNYNPTTAVQGKHEWANNAKFGAHYRRRRWIRYKEYNLDRQFVPKQIYPMIIKYEENETISLCYSHNLKDQEQIEIKKQAQNITKGNKKQRGLKKDQVGEAKGKKGNDDDDDWDLVSDHATDHDKYLLTIKSLFAEYGVNHSPGLQSFDSGSLVVLQSEQQSIAMQEHEREISKLARSQNYSTPNLDPLTDSDDDDDEKADANQRWNVLGVDSLYMDRFILPLIHQSDIAREENKAIFSIMSIYDPNNTIDPVFAASLQQQSIKLSANLSETSPFSSPSSYPITRHSHNTNTITDHHSNDWLFGTTEQVRLFKTMGYKTLNEDSHFFDEQDLLTEHVHAGSSDIATFSRQQHYMSQTFTPYRPAIPQNQITLAQFSTSKNNESSNIDPSLLTQADITTTPTSYLQYLTQSIARIPSGHLAALLQLWLEQGKYACVHNNVPWTNRVPPPLLYYAFNTVMDNKLIDFKHQIPPVPFIPTYCYQHQLLWSNSYFSIFAPHLPNTRPAKTPNDINASLDQYICFGDTIINNGNEIRSLVYKDHPLFLPPLAFRLIHVLVDNQAIQITTPLQQHEWLSNYVKNLHSTENTTTTSTGQSLPLLIYEMIAPVGYISLGLVARTTRPTLTHLYRCVPQEFVSVPTEHRQDDLAMTLPIGTTANDMLNMSSPPPPTSIRMFSNVDNYTRSERIGRVVSGFEKTAETLTDIIKDDNTYANVIAAKDKPLTEDDSVEMQFEKQSERALRHPWANRAIRASNLDVIDEAIANGVLAEALRDLAQFDSDRSKDHDQRTILKNVMETVNLRRGAQAFSSKIAYSALEKHAEKVKKKKNDNETDSDDELDVFIASDFEKNSNDEARFIYETSDKLNKQLGEKSFENLRQLTLIPSKSTRSKWNAISRDNTKLNSNIKLDIKTIEGAFAAKEHLSKSVTFDQTKDYYDKKRSHVAKTRKSQRKSSLLSGSNSKDAALAAAATGNVGSPVQDSKSSGMKRKRIARFLTEPDDAIRPTLVIHKTESDEELDASVIGFEGNIPKEGSAGVLLSGANATTNDKNNSLSKLTIPSDIQLTLSPISPRSQARNDALAGLDTTSLLGSIFEKKIERVVYPTLHLPYFRSNNLPLLPSLKYVHSTIEELTIEVSKAGVLDGKNDDDGLPISPTDIIPQESTSKRLVQFNSIIPSLTNNANTIALWNLPHNTFTLTTGQSEPINIRLGMSHVKPITTWCGELWIHTHTLEVLLCGLVTRRLYYRRKWEQYQQNLIEFERQEEEALKKKEKRRKDRKAKKDALLAAKDTVVEIRDNARDAIKARRLGHKLYNDSEDEAAKNDKKGGKKSKKSKKAQFDSENSLWYDDDDSDSEADDFYERPQDLQELEEERLREEKFKLTQEKFKRFYADEDNTGLNYIQKGVDDDDDDDRFNFIADDIALRKRFLFTESDDDDTEDDDTDDDNDEKVKKTVRTKVSLDDDSDGDHVDDAAEVLAMTSGLFGDDITKRKPKGKKRKIKKSSTRTKDTNTNSTKETNDVSHANDTDSDYDEDDYDEDEDYEGEISKITSKSSKSGDKKEDSTNSNSLSGTTPSTSAPRKKNIIIPGVDIEFGSLFNPKAEGGDEKNEADDEILDENGTGEDALTKRANLVPVQYDYLSPRKVKQLLPPMIAMIKHYSSYIRQLITQSNNIIENNQFSLPKLCLNCYQKHKDEQIRQFEEQTKQEKQQRGLWSSLSNRKMYKTIDNQKKRELQVKLHQFEEFERQHHAYLNGGIMYGNISLNITPFNFEYIPITSIVTIFTPLLYIPCTCSNSNSNPTNLSTDNSMAMTLPTLTEVDEDVSFKTTLTSIDTTITTPQQEPQQPLSPKSSAVVAQTSETGTKRRGLYDVEKINTEEDEIINPEPTPDTEPTTTPSTQIQTLPSTTVTNTVTINDDKKSQYQFPNMTHNLTQYANLISSSPPFLCPMTPYEHLACLLWLLTQTNRLCQQIRVSILEDLLYEGLHNSSSQDKVGSLVSLLIKWEPVLDFITPLSYVDTYICNQLLKKYNCAVPKRIDLVINQPFKTYIYNRCLDLVTHRFVLTITPALNAWDKVRNYVYHNNNNSSGQGTSDILLRSGGGSFQQKNQRYLNVSKDDSIMDLNINALNGTNSNTPDFNDVLTKETLAYDLITGQRVGDDDDDDDENADAIAKQKEQAEAARREQEEAEAAKGTTVSDADLAAEFAVDMGLTLVESNTQEQELKLGGNNKTKEEKKQAILQQLLMAMSSLTQDLLAVQRVGKKRLSIFKLFLFTYNDLILQILQESLHVDILVLTEKASVGEWLDGYDQLLKSITSFITIDTLHPLTPHQQFEMLQHGTYKQYMDLISLRPVITDVLHNIRTMRLQYITEYLSVVKSNINHMFENILMSETALLPRYQPYDSVAQFTGHFETLSPTDVYEILQTFTNSMLKQFRLYPIFNQSISILTKKDFFGQVLNMRVIDSPSEPQSALMQMNENGNMLQFGQFINMEQVLYEFSQLRITINNNPVDYEVLQDKFILITKLFDVLSSTQSYYFGALVLHLDRLLQRIIVNKGGIEDSFNPALLLESNQQNNKGFFGKGSAKTSDFRSKVFVPQHWQSQYRDQILSILDLPNASRLFTQAVTDMQKYTDEKKIQVKKKQSIGAKSLQLQYIFSNTISRVTSNKLARAITNTSSVSSIPLPHIHIIGHMNNVWDYISHRNGLIERFQNIYHIINDPKTNNGLMRKILSFTNKSIIQQSSRAMNFNFKDHSNDWMNDAEMDSSSVGLDTIEEDGPNNVINDSFRQSSIMNPSSPTNAARFNRQTELRAQYASFISYFEQLLERENDQVENSIYTLYYKCHDILITQCHYTILHCTNSLLFSNDWWLSSLNVTKWLELIHVQVYNTFIGLHVEPLNVPFVKQYLRKIVKNICYIYMSRFLACFYTDKKKPDFITNILKGTKSKDYSFEILLDKIFNDMTIIIQWCQELEGRLPPNIVHLYEKDLQLSESIKTDTILFGQFFKLCEYDDVTIIEHFHEVYNNITGTKYICEAVVQSVYSNQCIVTIGSLVFVLLSLKGISKAKVTNALSMIIQLCNQITQQKLLALHNGSTDINNTSPSQSASGNNSNTNSPDLKPLDRPTTKQLQLMYNNLNDDDDYESIFKHTTLRLYCLVEYGRGLSAKNTDGVTSDPYCVVKLMQGRLGGNNDASKVMEKKRTKSITADINPDWYEFITFPSNSLLFTDSIELSIFDSNWLSKDINMGNVRISRHSIEQRCIQMRKDNLKNLRTMFKKFDNMHNDDSSNQHDVDSDGFISVLPNMSSGASGIDNQEDKYTLKREEMLYQLEKNYKCTIWGYCTEKFALTIPNRGNLTCTFVLVEDH